MRVATLLKQASAVAAEYATEDQASDHTAQTNARRPEFNLNVTEDQPTTGQLQTILEYVGDSRIPSFVKGAKTQSEAIKKFKENQENFLRPVVCVSGRGLS